MFVLERFAAWGSSGLGHLQFRSKGAPRGRAVAGGRDSAPTGRRSPLTSNARTETAASDPGADGCFIFPPPEDACCNADSKQRYRTVTERNVRFEAQTGNISFCYIVLPSHSTI
eukprot:scaffold113053_cov63-Phaeocystis_antarctica.AAC.1